MRDPTFRISQLKLTVTLRNHLVPKPHGNTLVGQSAGDPEYMPTSITLYYLVKWRRQNINSFLRMGDLSKPNNPSLRRSGLEQRHPPDQAHENAKSYPTDHQEPISLLSLFSPKQMISSLPISPTR